jgi:hypothetical protein
VKKLLIGKEIMLIKFDLLNFFPAQKITQLLPIQNVGEET